MLCEEKFDGKPQTPLNVTVLSGESADYVKTLNNPLTTLYTCVYNLCFEDNALERNPKNRAKVASAAASQREILIVKS